MSISAPGLVQLAAHEGIVLGPYKDSVGVWTDGIGHTAAAGGSNPAKAAKVDTKGWGKLQVQDALRRALSQFDADLDKYEARVRKAIKVRLAQHEFDALVSFDFNTGGIHRAQLTKAINAGDKSGKQFMGWLRPPEIKGRRTAEMRLFQTGQYDHAVKIPIYDALGDGKIKRRATLTAADLLQLMKDLGGQDRKTPKPQPPAAPWWQALIDAILALFGGKK